MLFSLGLRISSLTQHIKQSPRRSYWCKTSQTVPTPVIFPRLIVPCGCSRLQWTFAAALLSADSDVVCAYAIAEMKLKHSSSEPLPLELSADSDSKRLAFCPVSEWLWRSYRDKLASEKEHGYFCTCRSLLLPWFSKHKEIPWRTICWRISSSSQTRTLKTPARSARQPDGKASRRLQRLWYHRKLFPTQHDLHKFSPKPQWRARPSKTKASKTLMQKTTRWWCWSKINSRTTQNYNVQTKHCFINKWKKQFEPRRLWRVAKLGVLIQDY